MDLDKGQLAAAGGAADKPPALLAAQQDGINALLDSLPKGENKPCIITLGSLPRRQQRN